MKRIVVIGTSGSGKTTFAAALARRLSVPHIEMDALHWEPGWVETAPEVFEQRVAQVIAVDVWVIDGNYSRVRSLLWQRADTIIWLDYALPVIFSRLLWRTVRRVVWRESCCNGNTESWRGTFSRDSIILWALQTYRRRRQEYPQLLAQPEAAHLKVLRFTFPKRAAHWLNKF